MTERESGWRAGSQAAGWKGERQKKERRYKSALGTRRKARAQARREWLWLMGWHGANVSNIDDCLNGRPAAAGTMRFNYPLHKNTDGWAKLIRKRCLSSTMERVEGSAGGIVTGPAAPGPLLSNTPVPGGYQGPGCWQLHAAVRSPRTRLGWGGAAAGWGGDSRGEKSESGSQDWSWYPT